MLILSAFRAFCVPGTVLALLSVVSKLWMASSTEGQTVMGSHTVEPASGTEQWESLDRFPKKVMVG